MEKLSDLILQQQNVVEKSKEKLNSNLYNADV